MPFPGFTINSEMLPQYVIVLQGEDVQIKQRCKDTPADRIAANPHLQEAHLDRRLKVYRDQNVHDSGASVQCFFAKAITSQTGLAAIENVKTVNVFLGEQESEMLSDIQGFIERNGKPCCLNLITDRDNKFLKDLEKKAASTEAAAAEGGEQPAATSKEEPEDELAKIIKAEEEEAQKKEAWMKHKATRDAEEEAKRQQKEIQELAKLELVRQ